MKKIPFKKERIIQISFIFTFFLILFGFSQFQNFLSKIEQINISIGEQKEELSSIKKEIEQLQKVNEEGLEKLKLSLSKEKDERILANLEAEKEKEASQQKILNLEEKFLIEEQNGLSNIINQWEKFVVDVECNFNHPITNELLYQTNGSGLLTKWENTSNAVLTNKHVISTLHLNNGSLAKECLITFPKENFSIKSQRVFALTNDFDWGIVYIDLQNAHINDLMQEPPYLCSEDPGLGDEVAILGYPNIGDESNVTVTEGIISGFDKNYFITSAKVEQGNSGGAAISLKNNCYLGTPTFSRAGAIESLARILDVKILFE
ncbi:MAG: trypsin-like peptidase domain-containing protein [Candidatus Pacebacteria bacterium]|nr:trypsin-like peptidase domain-containing protein [Candidatus Paceibacterota bacterium]